MRDALPLEPGLGILNLILNGVEAATVAEDDPRERVVSSETDAGNGVLVSVRDAGIGLDKADAARLFDAFYTTKQGGLGLGLAISRSIIESHRGRIRATPNAPRGAVFRFTLLAATAGMSATGTVPDRPRNGRG